MDDSLFLENALIQLSNAGVLQRLGGLILGDFEGHGRPGWRRGLVEKYAAQVPGPVLTDFPFGHAMESAMACVRWGSRLTVARSGRVTFE